MKFRTLLYVLPFILLACNQQKEQTSNPMDTKWTPGTKLTNYEPNRPLQSISFPRNGSNSNYNLKSRVNPPHGQPGHRCDIPVGAPLNAVVSTQTVTSPKPTEINLAQLAAQSKTPKGMNPPHGQPNHRCDIPVGAPLNSKPVQNMAQPQYATVNAAGQKLNPPHGQPNHRCDVAVGAPLDGKPAEVQPPAKVPTPAQTDTSAIKK